MKLGANFIILLLIIQGCTLMAPKIKTIYVPEGDAVMLRQDVKNVDIWAKTKDNEPVAGKMTLEEGWM
jgi:hypothetical protein